MKHIILLSVLLPCSIFGMEEKNFLVLKNNSSHTIKIVYQKCNEQSSQITCFKKSSPKLLANIWIQPEQSITIYPHIESTEQALIARLGIRSIGFNSRDVIIDSTKMNIPLIIKARKSQIIAQQSTMTLAILPTAKKIKPF